MQYVSQAAPVHYAAPMAHTYAAPQTYSAPVTYAAPQPVSYAAPGSISLARPVVTTAAPVMTSYQQPVTTVQSVQPVTTIQQPYEVVNAVQAQQINIMTNVRTNPTHLAAGGRVIQEQEYSREDMINMGYVVPFDQYFTNMDTNRNGQLSPEELRAGAEKVNRMPELRPHEVQSHLEQMLGIRSFGAPQANLYQGDFQHYLAPAAQGGHGMGYVYTAQEGS